MSQGGSYLVRCGSQDRQTGSISRFTVSFASSPNLQSVTAVRIHTCSFPNTQVNVPAYKASLLVGELADDEKSPEFLTGVGINASSAFKLAVYNPAELLPAFLEIPFDIFPAGTRMSVIADYINIAIASSSATGNVQLVWIPEDQHFEFTSDVDIQISIGPVYDGPPVIGAGGNSTFVSQFLGLPLQGTGAFIICDGFTLENPQHITPYREVSVTPGQYTADELAAELQTTLVAAFPTHNVTVAFIDASRNPRFLISASSALQFSGPYSSGTGLSPLGIVLGISEDTGFSIAYTTDTTPNLRGLTVVSLQSRVLATARCAVAAAPYIDDESLSISTVTEIGIDSEWLGWQNYRPHLNQAIQYSNPVSLTSLSLTFRDATWPGGPLIEMCEPGAHILLEVTTG